MQRILVVDDTVANCRALQLLLKHNGFEAQCADSGPRALSLLRAGVPDLVLLDLMMPQMSGLEVLEQIRGDPLTADLPVVMFSAVDDLDVREAALSRGADDYWVKGKFDFRTLRQQLETHLKPSAH